MRSSFCLRSETLNKIFQILNLLLFSLQTAEPQQKSWHTSVHTSGRNPFILQHRVIYRWTQFSSGRDAFCHFFLFSAVFSFFVLPQMKTKKRHRNSAPEWGAYCNLGELGQSELLLLLVFMPLSCRQHRCFCFLWKWNLRNACREFGQIWHKYQLKFNDELKLVVKGHLLYIVWPHTIYFRP